VGIRRKGMSIYQATTVSSAVLLGSRTCHKFPKDFRKLFCLCRNKIFLPLARFRLKTPVTKDR
jgi:hypothetical protein